jgi:hypothetical protein
VILQELQRRTREFGSSSYHGLGSFGVPHLSLSPAKPLLNWAKRDWLAPGPKAGLADYREHTDGFENYCRVRQVVYRPPANSLMLLSISFPVFLNILHLKLNSAGPALDCVG